MTDDNKKVQYKEIKKAADTADTETKASAKASSSESSATTKKTTVAATRSNTSNAKSTSAKPKTTTAKTTSAKKTTTAKTANKSVAAKSSVKAGSTTKKAVSSKTASNAKSKASAVENEAKTKLESVDIEKADDQKLVEAANAEIVATTSPAEPEQKATAEQETSLPKTDSDADIAETSSVADNADPKLDTESPAASDKDYILEVEGLQTYFPIVKTIFGKPKVYLRAVDNVGFKIERGTTLGVVGESGCGKTTLGRTILKLYDPNGGKIVFNGDDLTHLKKSQMLKYRTKLQLIFQDPYSSLPPRMTVGSIIAEAVKIHKIVPKEQVYDYVQGIMKQCGLQPQYYDRYPHEFSGGQRQRICIARALAVKPELVVCDEPVSALDVSIQAQIINLLKGLQQQMGLTYLFISHDLSVVKYITDRILVMYLGNMMELGDTDEIFNNPLHPYTQALFSAVPIPDPDVKMNRIILEGDIPSPAKPPKGCKFHTRCSKCMDVCKFKAPQYVCVKTESGKDHFVACHLYDEAVMNSLPAYTEEYNKLVAEQQAKEEQARIKKENSGWYKFKKKVTGLFKKKKKKDDAADTRPDEVENPDTQASVNEVQAETEKPTEHKEP